MTMNRFLTISLTLALSSIASPVFAQAQNCVTSESDAQHHSGCISADAAGTHIRADAATSPRLDVTVGGHTAFTVDPVGVKFAEPRASAATGFSPLITLNETNLATNNKHGIYGVLYTDNSVGIINSNLLALEIFTPPDNGGDVSGAYIRQTGGGNALSIFNLCGERPK